MNGADELVLANESCQKLSWHLFLNKKQSFMRKFGLLHFFSVWNMDVMPGSAAAILWPEGREPYTMEDEEARQKELGFLMKLLNHNGPSSVMEEKYY